MDYRFVTRLLCKFIQAIRLSISLSIARDLYKFSPPLLISQLPVSSSNLMQPSSLGRCSHMDTLQEGSRKKLSVTCFLTIIALQDNLRSTHTFRPSLRACHICILQCLNARQEQT
jgi:hypothetical protein